MRENWMAGKINPATGQPLEIVYPPLPPGTILSFVHWMPHGVTYVEKGTRWGVLLSYRTMDRNRRIMAAPQIPWEVCTRSLLLICMLKSLVHHACVCVL